MLRPHGPLALAAVGLALLLVAEHALAPVPMATADAPAHEGERVQVEGWVTELRVGRRGAFLEVSDGTARLGALTTGDPRVVEGDGVRVVGVVTRDGVGFLLTGAEVTRLAPSHARTVGDLVDDLPVGRIVTLRGTHLGGFLHDGDAALRLVFPGDEDPPEGPLTVTGRLDLDRRTGTYRVKVDHWTSW